MFGKSLPGKPFLVRELSFLGLGYLLVTHYSLKLEFHTSPQFFFLLLFLPPQSVFEKHHGGALTLCVFGRNAGLCQSGAPDIAEDLPSGHGSH